MTVISVIAAVVGVIAMPALAFAADFTTPQNAIRSLEAAYISKDLEAAVAAKDFAEEARRMLLRMSADFSNDPELVQKTAEVLEFSFRKQIKESGFPNFSEVKCSLGEPDYVSPTLVKVMERCTLPDGGTSVQYLLVFKGPKGWRVVDVEDQR
jgi:hypothetical protein